MVSIIKYPDKITLLSEGNRVSLNGEADIVSWQDAEIRFSVSDSGMDIKVRAEKTPLSYLVLRWNLHIPSGCRFLGDAWERGYGDLEWTGLVPQRSMPWYFLMVKDASVSGYGVRVRPSAMCFWQVDNDGITLWLDVRCGGKGVILDGRTLEAASVLYAHSEQCNPFSFAQDFCEFMCTDPILPKRPVYGSNNWYYAYGKTSREEIMEDIKYLAMLSEGIENRPFMVIDSGWQSHYRSGPTGNGGPWKSGNERFGDMETLAADMKACHIRPGIWIRLLLNEEEKIKDSWKLQRDTTFLDPSVPEVLDLIRNDVSRMEKWGYELLKHDFSTRDIFGKYGYEMRPFVTENGWNFWDTSKTSAEIIVQFYQAILESAGNMLIMGCNCVGHLGAGLMHIQRAGDDTSGMEWERTRKMGINTLAFRLPQHKRFFDIDADCVGIKGDISWEKNGQWMKLLSISGTPLFLSVKPGILKKSEIREAQAAFRQSAKQTQKAVPLDWMDTVCPVHWEIDGDRVDFDWFEEHGIFQFIKTVR